MLLLETSQAGLSTGPVGECFSRVDHRHLILKLCSGQGRLDGGKFASPDFQMQIVGAHAKAPQRAVRQDGWDDGQGT